MESPESIVLGTLFQGKSANDILIFRAVVATAYEQSFGNDFPNTNLMWEDILRQLRSFVLAAKIGRPKDEHDKDVDVILAKFERVERLFIGLGIPPSYSRRDLNLTAYVLRAVFGEQRPAFAVVENGGFTPGGDNKTVSTTANVYDLNMREFYNAILNCGLRRLDVNGSLRIKFRYWPCAWTAAISFAAFGFTPTTLRVLENLFDERILSCSLTWCKRIIESSHSWGGVPRTKTWVLLAGDVYHCPKLYNSSIDGLFNSLSPDHREFELVPEENRKKLKRKRDSATWYRRVLDIFGTDRANTPDEDSTDRSTP